MGLRYRKSINLGGGFRINLSKSGIGYSWGTKGYRITKTAKGSVRQTFSIPGTGISYSEESSHNGKGQPHVNSDDSNYYDSEKIVNSNVNELSSEGLEDIISLAHNALVFDFIANICIVLFSVLGFAYPLCFIFTALSVIFKIFVRIRGKVQLEYNIDDDVLDRVTDELNPMQQIIDCEKIWRVIQSNKVKDKKYTGGAGTTISRIKCEGSYAAPFPFSTSMKVATFKSKNETLVFLPDKLFVIQKRKVGALNYSDVNISASKTRFIESEKVPYDAVVVDTTWRYVNKSGGPDKRFKNNRQLPVCLYGQVGFRSSAGLNTEIMYSNPNAFTSR